MELLLIISLILIYKGRKREQEAEERKMRYQQLLAKSERRIKIDEQKRRFEDWCKGIDVNQQDNINESEETNDNLDLSEIMNDPDKFEEFWFLFDDEM